MNDLRALKPAGLLAAVGGGVLLVLWLLVSRGVTEQIVPAPEQAAEQFIAALGAHRYEAAYDLLSEELRVQLDEEQLRELTMQIEQARQGIEDAHGRADSVEERQGGASAEVEVDLANGAQQRVRLELAQEHGLWKVSSVEPLRALARR